VRPFLLAISVIRSGIGGQGKNADKHFAAVNPESQASLEPGQAFVRRTAHCRLPTPSRQAQEDKGVKCVAAVPVTQQKRLENRGSTGTGRRSEEHTSELQSHLNLVCRLLLEKKKTIRIGYK